MASAAIVGPVLGGVILIRGETSGGGGCQVLKRSERSAFTRR